MSEDELQKLPVQADAGELDASRAYEVASHHTDRALDAAGEGISKDYNFLSREGSEKAREAMRLIRERSADADADAKPRAAEESE